tara:strand:+ start:1045 stop:1317 length:273 start_codon:yes stop_codon:yes gene_type:complete
MPRLLVKGTEAAMATASGSASTFGNATVVRIVNTASNADTLVTVAESAGGTVVGTFTLMRSESALIEKQNTHVIFAAAVTVKGTKVGYTN